jgi:hypothetical protein
MLTSLPYSEFFRRLPYHEWPYPGRPRPRSRGVALEECSEGDRGGRAADKERAEVEKAKCEGPLSQRSMPPPCLSGWEVSLVTEARAGAQWNLCVGARLLSLCICKPGPRAVALLLQVH